jgi:hypothetical protein
LHRPGTILTNVCKKAERVVRIYSVFDSNLIQPRIVVGKKSAKVPPDCFPRVSLSGERD